MRHGLSAVKFFSSNRLHASASKGKNWILICLHRFFSLMGSFERKFDRNCARGNVTDLAPLLFKCIVLRNNFFQLAQDFLTQDNIMYLNGFLAVQSDNSICVYNLHFCTACFYMQPSF